MSNESKTAEPDAARMPDNQVSDSKESGGKETEGKGGDLAGLRRITLIAIGIALIIFVYFVIAARTTPFSGDARVQAFVLRVAPELNGRVEVVGVTDNQVVEANDEFFVLDRTPFQIAVDQAEARLAEAGQDVGASTASVDLAQAKLDEARAAQTNVEVQSERVLELVRRGVYPKAREDDALAAIDEAKAVVESAEADLRRAKEELGPQGQDNPQIQDALAALEDARYDLARTSLTAPARGVVTNLQLSVGQTVVAGQPVMTFISSEDIWLLAPMRENSLNVIEPGQKAEVVLDSLPGQVYDAEVRSIGWGIASENVDPTTGLPKSTSESGWLANPERFPVQLTFDPTRMPKGARYGSKAAVMIYSSDNFVMRAIAWARVRLIALLTYVS